MGAIHCYAIFIASSGHADDEVVLGGNAKVYSSSAAIGSGIKKLRYRSGSNFLCNHSINIGKKNRCTRRGKAHKFSGGNAQSLGHIQNSSVLGLVDFRLEGANVQILQNRSGVVGGDIKLNSPRLCSPNVAVADLQT